jgi:asparagine synthase (glutamine-hydrolysing)
MCGILLVQSRTNIPLERHLAATSLLNSRGPDFTRYQYRNGIFVAQTVLHITGTAEFYNQTRPDFLAYNGEIYNHRWFGKYSSDTELAYRSARDMPTKFKHFEGPWAWAYTDFENIRYATDPQGEKCLYHYQDDDLLIVSSEIAPILEYCNFELTIAAHTEKHWPVRHQTPWKGITRCSPGMMYSNTDAPVKIDSIFDWHKKNHFFTFDEAYEEFKFTFEKVIGLMTPKQSFGITVSGGLDSACILKHLPNADHFYTVDTLGKDTVSPQAHQLLTQSQQQRNIKLPLDAETWATDYKQAVQHSKMPMQSWSFVGQWHIARHCQEKILFTGVGADELFGGYDLYKDLVFRHDFSSSPYSKFAQEDKHAQQDWKQCLEFYQGYGGPATLLMDYLTMVSAVDLRGVDAMTQAHGVEPRSPFVHPDIIKFAINLPWEFRLGKPFIKRMFLESWPQDLALPKQGFAGHCNDSYPWLGVDIPRVTDREQDWKNINRAAFAQLVG